jgi:TolA-binding protein
MSSLKWWEKPRNLYGVVGVLAVLLIASIVGLSVVAASQSDKADRELADARDQIEGERKQARDQIARERTALEGEKTDLEGEIESLNGDASQARKDARREEKKLARLKDQVSGVQQQIADNTIPGDGTFVVGKDIQPGTYKSEGQDSCYWARLAGLGGGLDDIIANDNTSGPVTIEVSPGDRALELSGCAEFVRQGG